jgi:hypothetical protein
MERCPGNIEQVAQRLTQELEITDEYDTEGYASVWLAEARHMATNYEEILYHLDCVCYAHAPCPVDPGEGEECPHKQAAYLTIKYAVHDLLKRGV